MERCTLCLRINKNLSPYKITKAQLLSEAIKTKGAESYRRAKLLLENLWDGMFRMFRKQKPASVMVWAGITSTEEMTPLIFIEEGGQGESACVSRLVEEQVGSLD